MMSMLPRAARVAAAPWARLARHAHARLRSEPWTIVAPATLIVSSRHRLWQRYGPEGVFDIERAMGALCRAMAERGIAGTPLYIDDSPLLTAFGVLPADPSQPRDIARVIREVSARMAWTDEEVRDVLLIGDDGIVPFFRLPNPSDDDDEFVASDHPYGADPSRPIGEARGVGRMPDAGLEPLLAALQAATEAHRALAAGTSAALAPTAFGYSASIWKRAARGAFAAVGEARALRLSPPLSVRDRPRPDATGRLPRFHYYNLHGLVDSPDWFGQVDPAFPADYAPFPVALQPGDLPSAAGTVVVAECCYGAHLEGRSVAESVALSHMAGGALAFFGATGVAYGGLDGPLVAADLLAFHLWRALLDGLPAGRSLARAKALLVADAMSRQGYLDGEDEKTVAGFVLYGDPSLPHATPGEAQAAAFERAPRALRKQAGLHVAAPVPMSVGHGARIPEACTVGKGVAALTMQTTRPGSPLADEAERRAVEQARRVVSKQLPGFGGSDVRVSVGRSGREGKALAKGLPDPSRVSAGSAGGAPHVITLARSIPTCAGPLCRTVVRVTVDQGGHVRKMSVSR